MSMNLIYKYTVKSKSFNLLEFEYQTSTEVTYKVLATNDKSLQLKIIEEDLVRLGYSEEHRVALLQDMAETLKDEHITLSII